MFHVFEYIVSGFKGHAYTDVFSATQSRPSVWALSYNARYDHASKKGDPYFALEFDMRHNRVVGDGNRKLYILEFWIPPSARRQGWGSSLYKVIEMAAQKDCVDFIQLTATGESKPFWPKMGFSQVEGEIDGVWRKNLR